MSRTKVNNIFRCSMYLILLSFSGWLMYQNNILEGQVSARDRTIILQSKLIKGAEQRVEAEKLKCADKVHETAMFYEDRLAVLTDR